MADTTWRDLANLVDGEVVSAFDETGVELQKMANGVAQGAPIPLPCEFEPAYVDERLVDGQVVSTTRPAAWLHNDDLAKAATTVAVNDRLILTIGPSAGTYTVDSLEPNNDRTGVMLRLKVSKTS